MQGVEWGREGRIGMGGQNKMGMGRREDQAQDRCRLDQGRKSESYLSHPGQSHPVPGLICLPDCLF